MNAVHQRNRKHMDGQDPDAVGARRTQAWRSRQPVERLSNFLLQSQGSGPSVLVDVPIGGLAGISLGLIAEADVHAAERRL